MDPPRKAARHHRSSGKFKAMHCGPAQMAAMKELWRPSVREEVGNLTCAERNRGRRIASGTCSASGTKAKERLTEPRTSTPGRSLREPSICQPHLHQRQPGNAPNSRAWNSPKPEATRMSTHRRERRRGQTHTAPSAAAVAGNRPLGCTPPGLVLKHNVEGQKNTCCLILFL